MNTLHERLEHLLRSQDLTQRELADKVGVSRQIISQLITGKLLRSKSLYKIADFFQVNIHWLQNGADSEDSQLLGVDDEIYLGKFHKIPLFYNLCKSMLVGSKLEKFENPSTFELTREPEYKHLFALTSTNNSLKFKFEDNAILIFNTELIPISGDFVIAFLPEKNLFIFRDIHIEKTKQILIPIDADLYKPIILPEMGFIVAVLCEKRLKRAVSIQQEIDI